MMSPGAAGDGAVWATLLAVTAVGEVKQDVGLDSPVTRGAHRVAKGAEAQSITVVKATVVKATVGRGRQAMAGAEVEAEKKTVMNLATVWEDAAVCPVVLAADLVLVGGAAVVTVAAPVKVMQGAQSAVGPSAAVHSRKKSAKKKVTSGVACIRTGW
jgi:hypothetical protein